MPLVAFFLLLFLPARLCAEDAASVTRETVHGVLRGELSADGRVCSFKGVPYAAPPVGELRWKPSQPVVPWDGVRDATRFGPRAMQGRIWDDIFSPTPN